MPGRQLEASREIDLLPSLGATEGLKLVHQLGQPVLTAQNIHEPHQGRQGNRKVHEGLSTGFSYGTRMAVPDVVLTGSVGVVEVKMIPLTRSRSNPGKGSEWKWRSTGLQGIENREVLELPGK